MWSGVRKVVYGMRGKGETDEAHREGGGKTHDNPLTDVRERWGEPPLPFTGERWTEYVKNGDRIEKWKEEGEYLFI
jgi:hypothetical protein